MKIIRRPQPRQFCSTNVDPVFVLRDPETIERTEEKVRSGLKGAEREIQLFWQWQDVFGVWHMVAREKLTETRRRRGALMFRCVGLEKEATS